MGTWTPLANQPNFATSTMLLLTDGTIMCHESGGINWSRLTPDAAGSYIQGTWSMLAPMHHTRLYYASAVLKDGRVFVAGGEYSNAGGETNTAEIYDPVLDLWAEIQPPVGWQEIGDAPCCVLPDGRVLLGSIGDKRTAIYDPVTDNWAQGPSKDDASSEETWTLLPDQTVLTAECSNHPRAEKYVAAANQWVSAGTLPVDLVESSSIEIGPALLLTDGRVFAIGATPHTAVYTPPAIANQAGSWAAGPDFPVNSSGQSVGAKDAPACLMPNGKVLCAVGPVDGVQGSYLSPTYLFEFDGAALQRVPDPPNAGSVPFVGRMLLTPNGEVLFAAASAAIYAYGPSGSHDPAWEPQITTCPTHLRCGGSYTLEGRQLNGLSQAVAYGDDAASATNYPLARIRNLKSGAVRYCRTFDHTTMGVATGTSLQRTNFFVPFDIEVGPSELCVVANGIPSRPQTVDVAPFRLPFSIDDGLINFLIGNLADGPLWVLGPHGPVPVDPWGAKLKARARRSWQAIFEGVRELQSLGHEVAHLRGTQSAKVAPAVDPDLKAVSLTRKHGRKGTGKGSSKMARTRRTKR